MIQRIQSIYLFLGSVAALVLLVLPFAGTSKAIEGSPLFDDQLYSIQDATTLLVTFCLGAAIGLASIFLFKNRPLQMRFTLLFVLLMLIGAGLAGFIFYQDPVSDPTAAEPFVQAGLFMPLAAIILGFLAFRSIRKDERLVRNSYDRLR